MAGKGQGWVLGAATFIILEIAAVFMLSGSRSLQDVWMNRATHRVLAAIWSGGESVRSWWSLREQNRVLAEENLLLAEALRRLEGQKTALSGAVADTVTGNWRFSPATIVKMSRNSQHNYIILDKGTADGIVPRSGIVTPAGVVGIVNAVDEHFCYGITLQNALVSVSARIGHDGTVAPLEWDGLHSRGAVLKNLPAHLETAPGDTVWTSGFSGIFPPDIPLGITGASRLVDGAVKEMKVELFLDFGALRHVTVVENLDREEIKRLEGGAGQ